MENADGDALIEGARQPDLDAGEEVKYIKHNVSVFLDDRVQCGSGTLFLTTENITWLGTADAEKTLSFHWRSMLMHAISRDTSSFPHPCVYCQVRKSDTQTIPEAADTGAAPEQDEDDDEEDGMMPDEEGQEGGNQNRQASDVVRMIIKPVTRDVRYVLDDPEMLGILFQVFSECQSLHPDEALDGEGDFMFNEDEVANGTVCMMNVTDIQQMQNGMVAPQDQAALDRWDALLTETDAANGDGDSQFEDADDTIGQP